MHASEPGQVQAEYAPVVDGIAVGCIVAVLFVGGALSGLSDSSARPLTPGSGPFTPPSAPADYPTTVAQMRERRLGELSQFESEAACVDYVNSVTP